MTRQVVGVVVGILLIIAMGGIQGYAQEVTARIPFGFRAGDAVLTAGTYTVSYDESRPRVLTIRGPDGSSHDVRIITRLAQKDPPSLDTYLVFDKVRDVYSLSEFWLPAMDGFFLGGEPLGHEHAIVKATTQGAVPP